MIIARVAGHIVATAKNPKYSRFKILRCIPERLDGTPRDDVAPIVALDTIDAGVGDQVLVCQAGKWAREYVGDMDAPVRTKIVAIVENIHVGVSPNPLG